MAPGRIHSRKGNPSRKDQRENQRNDRAWLAVKAFNELKPTLTSFARAVTGNNSITVQPTKGTSMTDMKTLWLQPPIGLGDRIEHDKQLCSKRDVETLVKMCPACASREMLLARLFHEIAHIAFDSNAPVLRFEREKVRELIREWHPKNACDHAGVMLKDVDRATNHLALVDIFHPFMTGILRSYEDARVDAKMYRARPGLKIPTEARIRLTFQKGIERADGTFARWSDTALNAQTIVGLLLLGMGLDIREGYLAPEVIEALADPELIKISNEALLNNSVNNSFATTIEAFLRLQKMGLCYVPKCVDVASLNKEPKPDNKGDGSDSDNGDDTDSGGSTDSSTEDAGADGEAGQAPPEAGGPDETADGMPGDSTPGDRSGEGGSGESPGSQGEPTADELHQPGQSDEVSGGDGTDQEGSDPDAEADEGGVPPEFEGEDAAKRSNPGGSDTDDSGDRDGIGGGGQPEEQVPGDQDEEPGSTGGGSESDDQRQDESIEEAGSINDAAGSGKFDPADGDSGTDTAGDRIESAGDSGGSSHDAEADAEEGLADDPGPGDQASRDLEDEAGHDDLDSSEEEESDSEARPELKGESVWNEDNPETLMDKVHNLSPEEFEAVFGNPEDVQELLDNFMGHGSEEKLDAELLDAELPTERDDEMNVQAVSVAIGQEAVFDMSSKTVRGVEIVQYPWKPFGWGPTPGRYGEPRSPADFMPAESIIGKSLMQARVVFNENKRAKTQGNLKSGRINTRVLGRRAALQDDRLFKKKTLPGKRDYFVVIGADCSGSTNSGYRNERIKRAVFAKAELLSRLGIPFAVYGHTGSSGDVNKGWWDDHPGADGMTEVWLMEIKSPSEPWNDNTRQRLADMPPVAENLDGHTLEYYRKVAQKSQATDRIVIYYTDGAMPAANFEEELVILESEIETCRKNNITLMAVGINTDSPTRYGFDTVRVDSDEDLSKVIDHLKTRLTN